MRLDASAPDAMDTTVRPAFARWLGSANDVTKTFLTAGRIPGLINMAGGLPAPETYPVAELAELARKVIDQHPQDTLGYGPIEGLPELRDALARQFSSPGLELRRENVLVTSGGMQGLDLIGKVMLEPGGLIAAQSPTYLGALDAWRSRAPAYRKLMVERSDFDPIAALAGAQFGYTVPNFSNPTGRLVGFTMRQALVNAAHATGTWLVEDDPYGTLHYDGPPLPRMIELSGRKRPGKEYGGPLVYMGTLSKEIAPGLRIAWVVAEPRMINAMTIAKQGSDMCTSGVTQRIALAALEGGLVERIQPSILDLYRSRRDALCAALAEHLGEWLHGKFLWVACSSGRWRGIPQSTRIGCCGPPWRQVCALRQAARSTPRGRSAGRSA